MNRVSYENKIPCCMNRLFACAGAVLAMFASLELRAQDTFQVGNTTLTATNLASGIQLPWEILWGPDDFLWVTSRPGTVYASTRKAPPRRCFLSVTNNGSGEPGMLGMAMHPEWETTPKVFIVYATGRRGMARSAFRCLIGTAPRW